MDRSPGPGRRPLRGPLPLTQAEPEPAAHANGTRVELRDLFYAVPARLKFLKTPRSETNAVEEVVARLAMAHPAIGFTLRDEDRVLLRLPAVGADLLADPAAARLQRLSAIMGRDFGDNALVLDAMRENVRLTGYAGLPTLNRATASHQYLFVNGRPVKDRLLIGAIRGAYQDFLARDRHPLVALFVDLPPEDVDVNVHPTKIEVRFRDPQRVYSHLLSTLRQTFLANDLNSRLQPVPAAPTAPPRRRSRRRCEPASRWSPPTRR